MRHGEAAEAIPDVERPLTERGINEVIRASRFVLEKGIKLDRLLHSIAARTSMTAEYFAQVNRLDQDLLTSKPELYQVTVGGILQQINNFDPEWDAVGIIGHNPAISYLVEYMASNAESFSFGTAHIAVLDFEVDTWLEVAQLTGVLTLHYSDTGKSRF